MAEQSQSGKLAVILHADIAGSTNLVRQDEQLSHRRIQETFRRFGDNITKYHGSVRELRGDAILAEFERASDAVAAALAFQADQTTYLSNLNDAIRPEVRVGIAMGEVIIADDTITGEGVVLAQRLEQLAKPGTIMLQGAAYETIPGRFPFDYDYLGEHAVKGFDQAVRVHEVKLKDGAHLPTPSPAFHRTRNTIIALASAAIIVAGIAFLWFAPWKSGQEPPLTDQLSVPLPDKPSIAVLPFEVFSDDPEQKHFANGLTEDLISALSKVPDIFVVSRTSTRGYKSKDIDVQVIAKEQGVRYVLEGSIQKSGEYLRVTAQLIDGRSDLHVWTEKYDRPTTEIFSLQDDIVREILIAMQVKLTIGDHAKVASRGTKSLDAWLLRLQAMAQGFTFTQEGMVRARELFWAAHQADPKWGRPLAGVAWTHLEEAEKGWSPSREASIQKGIEFAKRAIQLNPEDPLGYMQLGNLMAREGDWDQAVALREKAVELAPNDFNALVGLAYLLVLAGEETRAIELYSQAKEVSPIYPWWTLVGESLALHMNGQHERAIQRLKESMERNPKFPPRLRPRLAALYSDLGRIEEAEKQMAIYLHANPSATVSTTMKSYTFKDQVRTEWYADLLRKAGLPE